MAIIHQLIMRSGPMPGKEFPLESAETTIGRDLDNDIVINDAEVSRHHAIISLQMEAFVIEDKGSTNGTSVNGHRITTPYTLHSGDVITFGEHVDLLYEGGIDPNATVLSAAARQPETVHAAPPPKASQPYQPPIPREEFETPPPTAKKFPWLILILIIFLLIVCVCGISLYLIDANNMWCSLFPFLFSACS